MTNTRRKNALEEIRNPVHNRIRYQRRKQEEQEIQELLEEELKRLFEEDDDPLSQIP